jgi:hypothetical protein
MPIDPRIPLGVQIQQPESPMATLAQVYQLQNMRLQQESMRQQQEVDRERIALSRMQQERLTEQADLERRKGEQELKDDETVRGLFAQGLPPRETILQSGLSFDRAEKLVKGIEAMEQARLKTFGDSRSLALSLMGGVEAMPEDLRPAGWAAARNEVVTNGIFPGDQIPEAYNPHWMAAARRSLLTPKEQEEVGRPKLMNVAPGHAVINERDPAGGAVFTAPVAAEPPKPGTFEYFLTSTYGANPTGQQQTMARKLWEDAGRAPAQPQQRSLQPRMVKSGGAEVQANYDPDTGHYFHPDTGERLRNVTPPDTAEQRNKAVGRRILLRSRNAMKKLAADILADTGVQQRVKAAGRNIEAVMGNDPTYRTYQDARLAYAGNLAVAQQGTRPSDADIKAIWLPMVPDAYRDTRESKDMKFNLMDDFMDLQPSEREASDKGRDASEPSEGANRVGGAYQRYQQGGR